MRTRPTKNLNSEYQSLLVPGVSRSFKTVMVLFSVKFVSWHDIVTSSFFFLNSGPQRMKKNTWNPTRRGNSLCLRKTC